MSSLTRSLVTNRTLDEVAFFHKPSKTLILVDLLENISDDFKHPTVFFAILVEGYF